MVDLVEYYNFDLDFVCIWYYLTALGNMLNICTSKSSQMKSWQLQSYWHGFTLQFWYKIIFIWLLIKKLSLFLCEPRHHRHEWAMKTYVSLTIMQSLLVVAMSWQWYIITTSCNAITVDNADSDMCFLN